MKRLMICGLLILALAAALIPRPVPVMGWGLALAAPMTPQRLRELGGAYLDEDGGKVLYLTFDAGYENGCTGKILDVLKTM